MNNVFYELKKKGNVIHSTYAEIAKIRENHLASPACNENMMSQEKSKTKWDQDVDVKKSTLNVNQPEFVPRSRQSFGRPQNTYRGRGGLFFGGRPWKFAPAVTPQYNAGHPAYDPAIVSVYGPSHQKNRITLLILFFFLGKYFFTGRSVDLLVFIFLKLEH